MPRVGNTPVEDPRSGNISTNWSLNYVLDLVFTLFSFLHYLFFSRPPFTAFNQKELAGKIREGKFRRIPYRYSDELNDIITRMLNLKVKIIRFYLSVSISQLNFEVCVLSSRAMRLKKH